MVDTTNIFLSLVKLLKGSEDVFRRLFLYKLYIYYNFYMFVVYAFILIAVEIYQSDYDIRFKIKKKEVYYDGM